MLEGGEEGLGGQGGGRTTNINISAVDAAGVARLLRSNGPALVRAMKDSARNFAFQG
jgi:hypothetical protein